MIHIIAFRNGRPVENGGHIRIFATEEEAKRAAVEGNDGKPVSIVGRVKGEAGDPLTIWRDAGKEGAVVDQCYRGSAG